MSIRDEAAANRALMAEREERTRKKISRMARGAAWAVGIGIGALLARLAIPAEYQSEQTTAFFIRTGVTLISCGGLILVSIPVLRANALKVGLVINWLVMPAVIVKLILDATHH